MDGNLLEQQRRTVVVLRQLLEGVTEDRLRQRPAPDKWSVCEILAHLAEDELTSSWRYRQMIESDGVLLAGFDQDLWARLGRYETWAAGDALEMFRLLREANVRLLEALPDEQWQRRGIHAERGPMTVESLARHMTGHDQRHIEQIRRILL